LEYSQSFRCGQKGLGLSLTTPARRPNHYDDKTRHLRPLMDIAEIRNFIVSPHVTDHIRGMEVDQEKATGYAQYIGELVNEAEKDLSLYEMSCIEKLEESETETLRKTKLKAWTSEKRQVLVDLKLMYANLKSVRMTLMQAIKTRRTEPY